MTVTGLLISVFLFAAGATAAWLISARRHRNLLAAKTAENNAFLSASAQQLRAPLNQIVGALQALDFQKSGLNQKQQDLLGVLNQGSYNLRGALMDILDILDIHAGRLKIEPVKADFTRTVAMLERRFSKRARKKGVVLHFDTRKLGHVHYEFDQTRYIQCIAAIIEQSLKQTKEGRIEVSFDYAGTGAQAHGHLIAHVKDTSPGVDQYMTEAYFSPDKFDFNAEMMDVEGRRLRLMLARMLVDKMGGTLDVKSAYGSGVIFTMRVPVAALPAPAATAGPPEKRKPVDRAKPVLQGKTVLVADDDPSTLVIMTELLQQGGAAAVMTAQSGLDAVKQLSKQHCDLIFMDIQMPVVDGLTATREIRKCGRRFSAIPIIAMTTAIQPEDRARYAAAGINGVLAKPIIIDALFDQVEHVMTKGEPNQAA